MAIDPKTINTKITLKVKEGPGLIVGINELDSVDGVVDFKGIHFSEPGKYIISVIPSSPDLKETEFTLNILPEEEFIPQEDEVIKEEPVEGTRPIIAQIDQPVIKLEPMKFDATDNSKENQNIGVGMGFTPFFWYNGVQIPERDISFLEIYYEDYVPKATVTFKDSFGLIKSPETRALNDTKFEIFLNSGSDILKSIHLKFKLEVQQDNKKGTVTITGLLDLKSFYKIGYKSYTGTSFDTLRKISNELELGFNSNITNTNDSMKWRRNGTLTKDFIMEIIKHSYISDESFMIGYIDYYWCFNYVDIEKEWKRDISNDVGIVSTGVQHLSEGTESDKIVPLVLTNDPSNNSSPLYFTNYRLNNNSTEQTTQKGTFTESKVYDRIKKQFLKFNIDSQTSTGNDKIVLKGSPGDSSEMDNYRTNYSGKMDTDNVHENYLYAIDQNRRNLDELVKISIEMDLPQPNFNIYKYQKVKLQFINQKQTVTDNKILDERMSGDWVIIDIKFTWKMGSLNQRLTAVRKELGKTVEEIEEQTTAPQKEVENSEINENPIVENTNDTTVNDIDGFIFTDEDADLDLLGEEFTEALFEGQEESVNEITDEPIGQNIDEVEENIVSGGNVPINFDPNTKLLYSNKDRSRFYVIDPSNGLAGLRLKKVITELQDYLSKNGYPGVRLGNNGVMRDLVASTYPSNPARAVASLHGAGLAIDLTFNIPGKVWNGIGDNKNLAADSKLNKLIYKWVEAQGDITWGGQWGGSKPADGVVKGWGITEYHHFEIKAGQINKYWEPFKDDISKLGFDYKKLGIKVGKGSELERFNKVLLRTVNVIS